MLQKELISRTIGITPEVYEIPRMIRLSKALLCIDCDTIFTKNDNKIGTAKVYCPSCGGSACHYVAKFLNREE